MARGKGKQNPQSGHPDRRSTIPKPNNESLRISFLHQAAELLAQKSKKTNDATSRLSKLYIEELHEVRNIQQTLLGRDLRRSYCIHCNRIWIPNATGDNGALVSINKKRALRKCTDCGSVSCFAWADGFKTRNEKAISETSPEASNESKS